ncbi:MAG: fasciclin domain-containing protein [Gemmatimonadaceae bacterium]|nr:fasciclin domain-containing protein [Gemmatimonadaceae bacterium]
MPSRSLRRSLRGVLAHALLTPALVVPFIVACAAQREDAAASGSASEPAAATASEAGIVDSTSEPHIARIAAGSADHTTLVAALKAADLVNVLGTTGPFTVFAPVNAAFEALPAGTVDGLLKPESKDRLVAVLQHHVTTSALAAESFSDGQTMTMVDGTPVTFTRQGDATLVNGAKIVASIRASNGWVHVIDKVLLPGS